MHSTPASNHIEEYTMPSAEALLAGTLALMTGHVQASCCVHRELMADKIVSNLSALAEAPVLSPAFKAMLQNLCQRWQNQGQDAALAQLSATEHSLWHSSPEAMQ